MFFKKILRFKKLAPLFLIGAGFLAIIVGGVLGNNAGEVKAAVLQEFPLGISNPYDQKDFDIKAKLPAVLQDLGLSKDGNGIAGFVVDEMARKLTEKTCGETTCQKYDFTSVKDLIDLVVGQGRADLWVVLGSPSYYQFTDGKIREDGETYFPDGPISRQAYKNWLANLVNFVNSYGKEVSSDQNWHVVSWNLFNEVVVDYKNTFGGNVDKATTAYANFVIDSAEILRKLSPQSKIVLAGSGSGIDLQDLQGGGGEFYTEVFSKLKQAKLAYEPFDYWESHWFGEFKDYKTNEKVYGAKDFINFLKDNGYDDKEFVIRAGGTYSGQDLRERKGLMNNYQSEQDQANFLVKRFIYNIANGVKKIPWSTIYERDKYQGDGHVIFQYVSLIYDGYPDGVSKNQECADLEIVGMLPCPDPGKDVKKLSYYTYKKLIGVLKGSDWDNIQTIQEKDGVYVYKLIKQGKPVWVAWNDNPASKQIAVSGITSSQVKITEIIPKFDTGQETEKAGYINAFNSRTEGVVGGSAAIILGTRPAYVETDGSVVLPTPILPPAGSIIVTGYAWSDTIGWIEFNPSFGGVFYALSTGQLSGYAWSDNIGWIKFDGLSPDSGIGGSGAIANASTGLFSGWARACAGTQSGNCSSMTSRTDGWDGWMKFDTGKDNPVKIDLSGGSTRGEFSGYAWGSEVVGWVSFNCSNTNTCGASNYKVKAILFGTTLPPPPYELFVTKSGDGTGTVSSAPSGIDCGIACGEDFASYPLGTSVTLTASASASAGSVFVKWTGDCSGSGLTCLVAMSADKIVNAEFKDTDPPYELSVTKSGDGTGTVKSVPSGIDCGISCDEDFASYPLETSVTLTASASASSGSVFVKWTGTGGCSGTELTCVVAMNADKTVNAEFRLDTTSYPLTVTTSGTGAGTVTSVSSGAGTTVTLTASASAGSVFVGWTGACSGVGQCVVTTTAPQSVNAEFKDTENGSIEISVAGSSIIKAVIVDSLPANSEEVSLTITGTGITSECSISLSAIYGGSGTATFSPATLPKSGGTSRFSVKNIPGKTSTGTTPITITAKCGALMDTADVTLKIEKITSWWGEF